MAINKFGLRPVNSNSNVKEVSSSFEAFVLCFSDKSGVILLQR